MDRQTTAVRPEHRFDTNNLKRYLSGKLDFSGSTLTVQQYIAGQSNPTFYIETADKRYVLRKKPPGELLPGAHKVDREYAVQKALYSVGFPVPHPVIYCSDTRVIGTEFYIMEHVQGRIFRDLRLPGVSAAERTALYVAAVETLAKLHSLDVNTLGLLGYGKGSGYCERQVSTWTKQYKASAHKEIPAMDKLCDWLSHSLPTNDNEVSLVHGDFRIDNLIFHPTEARVLSVLDWELSTTGQPIADLAYFLMPRYWPSHYKVISTMGGVTGVEGIPSPDDLISIYCCCRGIPNSLPQLNFFIAMAVFKMAAIAQGIYARHLLGNASSINAAEFGESVEPLAELGLQIAFSPTLALPISDQMFMQSPKGQAVLQHVKEFMRMHVLPAQKEVKEYYAKHKDTPERWHTPPVLEELKAKARAAGLWNLFLPAESGLSQLDYAHIAEETGHCFYAPEVFNCQAPEPDVASSDATNMECTLHQDKDHFIINGKKWWSSGAGNPKCEIAIVMCRSHVKSLDSNSDRHGLHTMILVPLKTPGVKKIRPLTVFGQDDAIHGGHFEIHFDNVRVPASNVLLGEGRGFDIAQGRLGPGRLHHCMRAVGLAEWALELLCQRAAHRQAFGKRLYQHEVVAHWIAECRIAIAQTRLLTLHAAHTLDTQGNKAARKQIAMIKVAAGRMASNVVDCAIQVYGGAGVSDDFPLAEMYAYARTLRIADGPDEVHLSSIALLELRDQRRRAQAKL
ncbi:acyl-CoA dehydrogenase family member 11 isoform X2 [Megalobrama amblycephala]|uniref:acyl-CoA dehydrogenase family member 11 isoform X2 n=1 Tax=Megalobrama amblycephala TaxID=75352 RepID=UPI0020144775|nr:acyl-CoA dehydrogenase family member 11 isoform X2 [Megalobrama amblycephala]